MPEPVVVDELFYDIHQVGGILAEIVSSYADDHGSRNETLANEGESILDSIEEQVMRLLNVTHEQRVRMVEEESKRRKGGS